jgi:hypothetical protein
MSDLTFESNYWGDCCNTFDEDQKHFVYGKYMGLYRTGYSFDVSGSRIVDIGGGPTSMMLKTINLCERSLVVDPLLYPSWTYDRYSSMNIDSLLVKGEDIFIDGFDEAWIYNCLQHTDDPELIIKNALRAAKVLRIFEWVDIEPHDGHPQIITKKMLDESIGSEGRLITLAESGCFGKAYYNIHKQ